MNIVFVHADTIQSSPITWRGFMLHDAIKRTGLHHQVDLLNHNEFSSNTKLSIETCSSKQLIIIEGAIGIDLLFTVNFWKSRGKTVVVDIPLTSEYELNRHLSITDPSFLLSNLYANLSNNYANSVTSWDKFKWGVHLADAILVSSPTQVEHWQSTAPVKIVPECIDLEGLRNLSKTKNSDLVIGLFTTCSMNFEEFSNLHISLTSLESRFRWFPMNRENTQIKEIIKGFEYLLPDYFPEEWPHPISLIDLAVFWNFETPYPGFYRNVLELMANRIPWISAPTKIDQSVLKYGLIASTFQECGQILRAAISSGKPDSFNSLDEANFNAIGHNVHDQIHNILNIFAEILKTSNH